MPINLSNVICPQCQSPLADSTVTGHHIICNHCQTTYPLLAGKTPVIMKSAEAALAKAYLGLESYLASQQNLIKRLQTAAINNPARASMMNNLIAGVTQNMAHLSRIQVQAKAHISLEALAQNAQATADVGYSKHLGYLRRDWCWEEEAENELSVIHRLISQHAQNISAANKNALVLGAGTGRIAWEACHHFAQVYAVDTAMALVASYHQLLDEAIQFYKVNVKEVFNSQDMAIPLKATLSAPGTTPMPFQDKLCYLMADALNCPLAPQSMDAIISVYFTDVLPLSQLLPEINRLLKPGGIFIHFGPLTYHFKAIEEMLTADEVLAAFQKAGYQVEASEKVLLTHLATQERMRSNLFNNWAFVVRKPLSLPKHQPVALHHILEIPTPIQYKLSGALGGDAAEEAQVVLVHPGGQQLQIARPLLEILDMIDGATTLGELIKEWSEGIAISIEVEAALLDTMDNLVKARFLAVKGE